MADRGHGHRYPQRGEPRDVEVSKFMSYILRHGAKKERVKMSEDGWVEVRDLLRTRKMISMRVSLGELKGLVATNAKQRFTLKEEDGVLFIRAAQGHSMDHVKSDNLLRRLTLEDLPKYPVVVHGTTRENYKKIKLSGGLSKMARNHIHFAQGLPQDRVVSGMRNSSTVFIYLDTKKCLEEGVEVLVSENGVILLPGDEKGFLSVGYFSKVTFRAG